MLLLQREAAVTYDGLTYDRCRLVQVAVGGCDGGHGLETGVAIVDDAVVQLCITVLPEKQTIVYQRRPHESFSPTCKEYGVRFDESFVTSGISWRSGDIIYLFIYLFF